MARRYRFKVGDKVRIREAKKGSLDMRAHAGEVVTIKALCAFTWAYELEELPNL